MDYYNNTKNDIIETQVNKIQLKTIINSLPNNKARGYANLSNENFKYGNNDLLISVLSELLEIMLKYGVIPKGMNIGKIIPIIKDNKKRADDINNIRPITISDTFAVIFEKYLLININSQIRDAYQQFGFVAHSSTQHAAFVLREQQTIT